MIEISKSNLDRLANVGIDRSIIVIVRSHAYVSSQPSLQASAWSGVGVGVFNLNFSQVVHLDNATCENSHEKQLIMCMG